MTSRLKPDSTRPTGEGHALTFSGSRFGSWYFLAQAAAIAMWWSYLYVNPAAVPLFLPRGAAAEDLRADGAGHTGPADARRTKRSGVDRAGPDSSLR